METQINQLDPISVPNNEDKYLIGQQELRITLNTKNVLYNELLDYFLYDIKNDLEALESHKNTNGHVFLSNDYYTAQPNSFYYEASSGVYYDNQKIYEQLAKIYDDQVPGYENVDIKTIEEAYNDYDIVLDVENKLFRLPLFNKKEKDYYESSSETITNTTYTFESNYYGLVNIKIQDNIATGNSSRNEPTLIKYIINTENGNTIETLYRRRNPTTKVGSMFNVKKGDKITIDATSVGVNSSIIIEKLEKRNNNTLYYFLKI